MSLELENRTIKIEEIKGNEMMQLLLEGDVIVPDNNPDILKLLQTRGDIEIENVKCSIGRVNYVGFLKITILYLSKGNNKPVHSMTAKLNIDDFLIMDSVKEDMDVQINTSIQNIDYKILNDRKVSIKAIVNVNGTNTVINEYEVITNILDLPESQVCNKYININRRLTKQNDRFIVKDELNIPSSSPNINSIIDCTGQIINRDITISNDKVNISGTIATQILYKGENEESIIEVLTREIPFNGSIDANGATSDMYAICQLKPTDFFCQIRPDEDGEDRCIETEVTINARIDVKSQEEVRILSDAYALNKNLIFSKKDLQIPRVICKNKNQSTLRETLEIANSNILQILKVNGKECIDDVYLEDDRGIIEGVIDINILYIDEDDDMPIRTKETQVPFRQVIELRGARKEMDINISSHIEGISFNMLNDSEMEIRIIISFDTEVYDITGESIIENIISEDIPKETLENLPSMVIYVVASKDTLWSIAKKYNTTIEEIAKVNEIESPDLIYIGQKLLILKNIF